MNDGEVIVFAGPSLPDRAAAEQRLAARFAAPAGQGDILRAALTAPAAIVLIDGYFERVPAVYHKEILWALSEGIAVYGAASLGALRAAELAAFGMVGVGEIFTAYAEGRLTRDDEVALVHGPAEAGFAALSEPLVNIRWTLDAAVAAGVITADAAETLCTKAAALFYPARSFKRLLELGAATGIDIAALADWLPNHRIDQKARDALACLDRVEADRAAGAFPIAPDFSFQRSDAFERLLREITEAPWAGAPELGREADILERLRRIAPDRYAALRAQAEIDVLADTLDAKTGGPLAADALAQQVAAFKTRHALAGPDDIARWLTETGIDIDGLSKTLESDARAARARQSLADEVEARLIMLLKSGGTYAG